jgi:hypothetical protein
MLKDGVFLSDLRSLADLIPRHRLAQGSCPANLAPTMPAVETDGRPSFSHCRIGGGPRQGSADGCGEAVPARDRLARLQRQAEVREDAGDHRWVAD